MPTRVTQGMMHSQMIRSLNRNFERMSGLQEQLTTGRKINRPSDDPVGITYALRYRSELSMNEQYQRNITEATSSVDHLDTVLDQVNDLFKRAKELTVQGISDTSPAEARKAISQEMDGIYRQLVTLGNDQVNGKFIFNGQMTTTSPYDLATAGTIDTDDAGIILPLAPGVEIATNVTGNAVFGTSSDADNLFKIVKQIRDAMDTNDPNTARTAMGLLDQRLNKFLGVRAEVGARANRIELLDNRNQALSDTLNGLSGKTEDADIAETIMNLKRDENVYQASLSTGARIIQPSLVDFLR
ncbi:flagellar hook-associated protein FlgL [Cohnella sp. CFH 77786]|uniref:flagellar hook-associated protein FlgL n=1 Tax=Cohnella sp. CFH 77786 TaxID=2662265 RepID=UPI001C609059|nr:flagellar hook-associated protein FlgL [Cohnella sp. CFH 77786]MBW5448477.1 flagellar hook-associated protein FlgL [Cohnella sp. CFH 77786]